MKALQLDSRATCKRSMEPSARTWHKPALAQTYQAHSLCVMGRGMCHFRPKRSTPDIEDPIVEDEVLLEWQPSLV